MKNSTFQLSLCIILVIAYTVVAIFYVKKENKKRDKIVIIEVVQKETELEKLRKLPDRVEVCEKKFRAVKEELTKIVEEAKELGLLPVQNIVKEIEYNVPSIFTRERVTPGEFEAKYKELSNKSKEIDPWKNK